MSTLPLPATRLAGTVPPAVLVRGHGAAAEPLAARVQKAREEDEEDSTESDE